MRLITLAWSRYSSTTALRSLAAPARPPQSAPSCMDTTSLHLLHNLTSCDRSQSLRSGSEPIHPAGRGRIHLFRLLPTRAARHREFLHAPGAHTGFSARFDSRYAIATDRSRAVPKHSCIRAPKGGLLHGACCSRATSPTLNSTDFDSE